MLQGALGLEIGGNYDKKIVECGGSHELFLDSKGDLFVHGDNKFGQLGIKTLPELSNKRNHKNKRLYKKLLREHAKKSKYVDTLKKNDFFKKSKLQIKQISCGGYYSLFLTHKETVYSCGSNKFGELGLGKRFGQRQDTPKQIEFPIQKQKISLTTISYIHASWNTSAFITSNHNAYTCGSNIFHQCAIKGKTTNRIIWKPLKVSFEPSNVKIFRVYGKGFFFIYVSMKGDLFGVGSNSKNQLGFGNEKFPSKTIKIPTKIVVNPQSKIDFKIYHVGTGYDHTTLVTSYGVYSFGLGHKGQLGFKYDKMNQLDICISKPTEIKKLKGKRIERVYCGGFTTNFISKEGDLYCCGDNEKKQTGIRDGKEIFEITKISLNDSDDQFKNDKILKVSSGNSHSVFVMQSGKIYYSGDSKLNDNIAERWKNNFMNGTIFEIIKKFRLDLSGFYFDNEVTKKIQSNMNDIRGLNQLTNICIFLLRK